MKTMFHFILTPEDLLSGQGLRLFEILNPDTLPVATLRVAKDAVDVQLPPMGDGTQLPFLVPEVRQFLQALHQHWPHSAYFCDVCSPFMRVFALAQAQNLQVWHDERKQTFRVDQDAAHLERYVARIHLEFRTDGFWAVSRLLKLQAVLAHCGNRELTSAGGR